MRNGYYPANDQQYKVWLENFVSMVNSNLATFGLVAADLTPLDTSSNAFGTKLGDYQLKKSAAMAARAAKSTERDTSEQLLRALVRRINNHPAMTDALRVLFGLKSEEGGGGTVPIEFLVPEVFLETKIGQVAVHWGPNPQNERYNGKPDGVRSAIIYRKKSSEEGYQIVGLATRSPYFDVISGDAADYTYVVRYRGTRTSDLSAPSAAETIAARGDLAA